MEPIKTSTSALLPCGEGQILLKKTFYPGQWQVNAVKPHDNEETAGKALHAYLNGFGGEITEVFTGGERYVSFPWKGEIFVFDPNRIFSKEGIKKTLRNRSRYNKIVAKQVENFAEMLFPLFLPPKDNPLLTAHNNTKGYFSILSYRNKPFTLGFNRNPKRCIDDFFIVTYKEAFDFLASKGFNVAWETLAGLPDDGSLSQQAMRLGIPYINVEAMHGHLDEQIEMLDAVKSLWP